MNRLGVLVPLGPVRIKHHALSELDMRRQEAASSNAKRTTERQEETRLQVINPEKYGNFVALKR